MQSVPVIELKRHYRELPAEHATEAADIVADLIVNFLKSRTGHGRYAQPLVRSQTTQARGMGVAGGSAGNPMGRPR